MRLYREYILPTTLLAGTIIGAGIFALPFVFAQSGFLLGFAYLVVATFAYTLFYFMYADIIFRTPGHHRFVGYARRYGGESAFWLSIVIAVVQMVFVMAIFLILASQFLHAFLPQYDLFTHAIIFWFFGSAVIFARLKNIALLEFVITGGIVAIIAMVFVMGLLNIDLSSPPSFLMFNASFLLLPLAPILFSLAGRTAIPPLIDYIRSTRTRHIGRATTFAIIAGTLIPAIAIVLFVVGVLLLTPNPSEGSIEGLAQVLPYGVLAVFSILGLLTLLSTYLMIGHSVVSILKLDLRLHEVSRFFIVVGVPFAIYLFGFESFLPLVSFVGGVFVSLEGLMMLFLWYRARTVTRNARFIRHIGMAGAMIVFAVFAAAFLIEASALIL